MRGKTKRIKAHDRMLEALNLRKRGLTYREIAAQTGYKSAQAAHQAVTRALERTTREPADELRTLELERLDALLAAAWPAATGDGDDRSVDDKLINAVLRIMERRAKLLGLDAPTRQEVAGPGQGAVQIEAKHEIDYSKLSVEELRQLIAILRSASGGEGAGGEEPS